MTKVISVGGSIVAPGGVDTKFLSDFVSMAKQWLSFDEKRRLILVIGGGAPARVYQNAYREVRKNEGGEADNDAADWIGIMATRLNAQVVKACFGSLCENEVVYNPTENFDFKGRVLVAAGWKPGFSTDNDAVILAKKFSSKTVINLSNIEKVYTADPKTDKNAKPIDNISWNDFQKMVGSEWVPGKNCPFDPIASKTASEEGIGVICAGGKNINNIKAILEEKEFVGTRIG